MASQSVSISFVVPGTNADITVSVELDEERNKAANEERTSEFYLGDTVYFRVFVDPENSFLYCTPTDGVITANGSDSATIEDILTFTQPPAKYGGKASENTASLSHPASSGFTASALSPVSCGSVSVTPESKSTAIASLAGVGVYEAHYTSNYKLYTLKLSNFPAGWGDLKDTNGDSIPYPVVVLVTALQVQV